MKYSVGLLIGIIILLSGCVRIVTVEGSEPTPLIEKMPVKVAIYYDESFRNFVHSESLKEEGKWTIPLGSKNLSFFRNLMNAMFESVTEIDSPELTDAQLAELDGVVIPSIDKYGFLTPRTSGLNFFSASIHYRIAIYDDSRQKLTEYAVVGYGKSNTGASSGIVALGQATMLAIRDSGTRIATEFRELPEVRRWLEEKEK